MCTHACVWRVGSQCELMMDYFQAFCSKNCCFEDLSVFLEGAGSVEPFISAAEGFVGREEPVQFDCREEDIRENVRTHTVHRQSVL